MIGQIRLLEQCSNGCGVSLKKKRFPLNKWSFSLRGGVDIPPPGGQYCGQKLKNVDNLLVAQELGVSACLLPTLTGRTGSEC